MRRRRTKVLVSVHVEGLKIVSPTLFEAVRRTMVPSVIYAEGECGFRRSVARNIKYLVIGLAFCKHCGRRLHTNCSTGGHQALTCPSRNTGAVECRTSGFMMTVVERLAIRGIRELLDVDDFDVFRAAFDSANGERRQGREEELERFKAERRLLDRRARNAMSETFDSKYLAGLRKELLEEIENRLLEVDREIHLRSHVAEPTLAPETITTLRGMLDELDRRTPFVAATREEVVVFEAIRSLIGSIKVEKIKPHVCKATITYTLGPMLGQDSPDTNVVKTFTVDVPTMRRETWHLKRARARELIDRDAYVVDDDAFATISESSAFKKFFATYPSDVKKRILRALMMRGAESVPLSTMKEVVGDTPAGVWNRIVRFRQSEDVAPFCAAVSRAFPELRFKYEAIKQRQQKIYRRWSLIRRLEQIDHPFLRLAMCQHGTLAVRIPDRHWQIVEPIAVEADDPSVVSKEEVTSGETMRRTLEGLALSIRDDVSSRKIARRAKMTTFAFTRRCIWLADSGGLKLVAEKLLELAAEESAPASMMRGSARKGSGRRW